MAGWRDRWVRSGAQGRREKPAWRRRGAGVAAEELGVAAEGKPAWRRRNGVAAEECQWAALPWEA